MLFPTLVCAQINTERVMTIARNALYFEDYVLSIQYFNQVINAKPYLYEPYFFRALAKVNLEDYQGAEADCDEAIKRNPFVVGAISGSWTGTDRQSKFDGAIEDYQKALHYDPENITLWHNLTLSHIQKKDYDAARRIWRACWKFLRAIHVLIWWGRVSLQQKDTVAALKDFNTALELDKYDPDAWSGKGVLSACSSPTNAEAESDLDRCDSSEREERG